MTTGEDDVVDDRRRTDRPDPFAGEDDTVRPVLITGAALPHDEQHRRRVRKYLSLMAFRLPALVLAALAYGVWQNGLISLAIIAASIPLPWMAVLIANDRPPRTADEPRRFSERSRTPLFPTAARPVLERGRPAPQPDDGDGAAAGER